MNIINGNNVTLTLNWDELFNNFDPIVNYVVSCSGDVTCPPNFTTTTRNYTITNLIPMTDYTFSVVATNSIGSGEAGVVMIATPGKITICIFFYRYYSSYKFYNYLNWLHSYVITKELDRYKPGFCNCLCPRHMSYVPKVLITTYILNHTRIIKKLKFKW